MTFFKIFFTSLKKSTPPLFLLEESRGTEATYIYTYPFDEILSGKQTLHGGREPSDSYINNREPNVDRSRPLSPSAYSRNF